MTHLRDTLLRSACALALAFGAAAPAWADRPFLATDTAAAEDDDEEVWSADTWLEAGSSFTGLRAGVEYAFNPYNEVAFGVGWGRFKEDGIKFYERELELEYKHILVDIAKGGWGLGVGLAAEWEREDGGFEHAGTALTLPFTWRDGQGTTLAHLTPGVFKPSEGKTYGTLGLAVEHEVAPRQVLFAEIAGDSSDDKTKLVHAGWRHWLRPGKMAVDVTVGRVKGEGEGRTFATIGLSLFDLK